MTLRKKMRGIGKGVLWAVLPVYAFQKLVSTKESLVRIREMARRGKTRDVRSPDELSEVERKRWELEAEGREIVLHLEVHDRFVYMATQMGWTEEIISSEMRALSKAHAFRFCLLLFTLVLDVGLTIRFGFRPFVFGSGAALYLSAVCLKTACLYTQLDERALWSFSDLMTRPNFWIWRRAFWFLG
jgi:hypothetical protein